jgi:hypothetical protein
MSDMGGVFESVAAGSDSIGERVENLINIALDQLERDLTIGDQQRRADAMKLILTHAMKARERVDDETTQAILNETREMLQEAFKPQQSEDQVPGE